jgi:hypothetical protein
MAEKKPFIAARLRNPAEVAQETKPQKTGSSFDYIGNILVLISLVLAGVTLFILKADLDSYTQYFM